MDHNQPTLKDLAQRLNLSIGTVQRALHNKGGYRPETQQRVLEEARKIGYTVNAAASSLRRNPVTIAVLLPEPVGVDRFFYSQIWRGIDQASHELATIQVNFRRFYARNNSIEFYQTLQQLSESEDIHGVIAASTNDERCRNTMERFAARNIPVMLINKTREAMSISTGALAADIFRMIHRGSKGHVLLLAGSFDNELLQRRARDFAQQLQGECQHLTTLDLHLYHDLSLLDQKLRTIIGSLSDLVGIVAVSARETMCMCHVLADLGLSGTITTIGMDAFPEMAPYFADYTLTASIYHYPARLAYVLAHQAASELIGINFPCTEQAIPTVPVFHASADFFCNNAGVI